MNALRITFLSAILFALIIDSCSDDYLTVAPLGILDDESLANKKGVEGLLIGAYSLLDGIGGNKSDFYSSASNWIYGSICGGEAYTGSDNDDKPRIQILPAELFTLPASSVIVASKWATIYDGIYRSNDVLRVLILAKDISREDSIRISAEARFLRAHYHFEAKKMWDMVPFVDETITYGNRNFYVSNQEDIWPDIEKDLTYAMDNLEEEPFGGSQPGRADKFAAMALLAKAYMFQSQKFTLAKQLLEKIITSGKYKLVPFHDNFNPATKNNMESVFSAQMSVNDGAVGANGNYGDLMNFPNGFLPTQPGGCCGYFMPSQYLVEHFKTDQVTGLPDLDNFNTGEVTTDEGIDSSDPFNPYDGPLDPRLDWTVGRRGIPYLDWGLHPGEIWIRNQPQNGPYSPKKNSYYKSQKEEMTDNTFWSGGTTANNVNLIRYADVLLWAAEAEVDAGTLDKAQEYVNLIRNRAADPSGWVHTYIDAEDPSKGFTNIPAANYVVKPYPPGHFVTKGREFARKAVRYERMLELGMEGHRFFDLVRWDIAHVEINAYLNVEKTRRIYLGKAAFDKDCDEYFPIPQEQLDLSAGGDGPAMIPNNACR
jgi:hypothetical protein